jgi:hypothetical protein
MDLVESMIDALNRMLKQQETNAAEYLALLNKLKAEFKLRFILIDLEKYNEEKMLEHQQKKMEAASQRNFEHAAWQRTLEDECKEYIDLKNSLDVTSPMFIHDDGFLFYFFFGKYEVEEKLKQMFAGYIDTNMGEDNV